MSQMSYQATYSPHAAAATEQRHDWRESPARDRERAERHQAAREQLAGLSRTALEALKASYQDDPVADQREHQAAVRLSEHVDELRAKRLRAVPPSQPPAPKHARQEQGEVASS